FFLAWQCICLLSICFFVPDERVDSWPLVSSPAPVAFIFLLYVWLVEAGPILMRHKQPLNLRVVLVLYNFSIVGLSAYMFYELLVTSLLSNYYLFCQPVDYSTNPLALRMAKAIWWFFISKQIELSDTMFMILRKKHHQLSFLHVYHHCTMICNSWFLVKYVAGGQSFFGCLLNSFVHIIMYLYYGLAAIGPQMKKYLWWKKYLTVLQLVQFLMIHLHTGYNLITNCDYPVGMNVMTLGYCTSLTILFCNFYNQSYISKRNTKYKLSVV
uniref:Elongation of very long chain fatty acids protein n=1 Tax=Periophthalmus magnuspinnatus TaxID=409849 RepID=A0A3B4AUA7_9GOBI